MKFDENKIKITDERLNNLVKRFTPLYQKEGKTKLKTVIISDYRTTAFTWSPTLGEKVNFKPLVPLITMHACNYYGFFKPSIAEVLAHVDDALMEEYPDINAFYIDLSTVDICSCGGGHRATTTFGKI